MAQARRMKGNESERESLKREMWAEVQQALDGARTLEEFRDNIEAQNPVTQGLSYAELSGMSMDQVNENWEAVSEALAAGPDAQSNVPQAQSNARDAQSRAPSIRELRNTRTQPALTREQIKRMSNDEINSRWPEVQAFLSSEGSAA
jgi:hypothetical protein